MAATVAVIKLLPVIGPYKSAIDVAQSVVGPAGVALTVAMFASPLSAMTNVIKTKNATSIPLPFTLASLVNCFCWTVVGIFQYKDPNVIIPNTLGLLCSMVQASLKILYRKTTMDRGSQLLSDGQRGGGGGGSDEQLGRLPATDLPI
jgi:solute carrier family 50 protein (sugar transporter)